MQKQFLINLIKSLLFGITYAVFEVNVPFYKYIPDFEYRILYFTIFIIVAISTNYLVWLGNFMFSIIIEDTSYWLLKAQLPFSYAWYYPVIDHIPIIDIAESILATIFYIYALKRKEK